MAATSGIIIWWSKTIDQIDIGDVSVAIFYMTVRATQQQAAVVMIIKPTSPPV